MSRHDQGHVTRIGSRPSEEFARPTFAAGAVIWRFSSDAAASTPNSPESTDVEIAIIHRPRYDD